MFRFALIIDPRVDLLQETPVRTRSNFSTVAAIAGGAMLVVTTWLGMSHGVPAIWAPLPLVPLTLNIIGLPAVVMYLAAPALLWMWHPRLFAASSDVPRRSVVALVAASLLTPVWLVSNWHDGLAMQGPRFVMAVAVANGVILVLLWLLFAANQRRASFTKSFSFHWLATAWLFWGAFPYLGPHP